MRSGRTGLLKLAGCWIALLGAVLACRFNVRDVGFVDLGAPPYQFYCVTDSATPPATTTAIQEIAAAAFFNTNIEPQWLTLADAQNAAWYQQSPPGALPAGFLVTPQGDRSLAVPLVTGGEDLQDTLWTHMEAVFESPARKALLAGAVDSYGVIVLVEGPVPAANARVQTIAQSVLSRVETTLGGLEKAIDKPPVLQRIPRDQIASESVLLWSLGIEPGPIDEPIVSVIYGRGRQIGQVLRGAEIDETALFNVVRTIGLDCECGLDRTWMQGPLLPLKWDGETQARVADQLGFDAEDPLIKMEMSQILSKGQAARRATPRGAQDHASQGLESFLANYEASPSSGSGAAGSSVEVAAGLEKSGLPAEPAYPGGGLRRHLGLAILAGAAIAVLLAGVFIILRARRSN